MVLNERFERLGGLVALKELVNVARVEAADADADLVAVRERTRRIDDLEAVGAVEKRIGEHAHECACAVVENVAAAADVGGRAAAMARDGPGRRAAPAVGLAVGSVGPLVQPAVELHHHVLGIVALPFTKAVELGQNHGRVVRPETDGLFMPAKGLHVLADVGVPFLPFIGHAKSVADGCADNGLQKMRHREFPPIPERPSSWGFHLLSDCSLFALTLKGTGSQFP